MRTPFHGVPSFFRGLCAGAARREHRADYSNVGREFFAHLVRLNNCDSDAEEQERTATIECILQSGSWREMWAWFEREYPRCSLLIGPRRREKFCAGMFERYAEEGMVV